MATEVRDVERKALSVVERAVAVKVTDPSSYIIAGEMWKHLADMEKEAHAALDPVVDAAHKAHKETVALRTRILAPITEAKSYTKGQMEAWDAEQERIRLAEERRLQEEARKTEEARKAADLEEARRIREEEEARLLAEAQKAEAEGNTVLAEAILEVGVRQTEELKVQEQAIADEPVVAPIVIVEKAVPKVAGGPSYRTIWDAQVVDLMALVKAVAAGTVSINAIQANPTFLRQQAMSLKQTFSIPGCLAYSRRV
jgi:hypothetical protein